MGWRSNSVRTPTTRAALILIRTSLVNDSQKLTGEAKRLHRLTHSNPHVEAFFDWIDRRLEAHGLRPKDPFINALALRREPAALSLAQSRCMKRGH